MNLHSRTLPVVAIVLVTGLVTLSGCGASVGTVEDAVDERTTTTSATDNDTRTTTTTRKTPTTTRKTPTTGPTSGAAAAYVDAMTASMLEDDDFPATEKHARCLASRFVDIIGADTLAAKGVTPEQFADDTTDFSETGITTAQANKMYDAFGECDFDLRALMLEDLAQDDEITPAMQACMEQVFTDDNLRKLMVVTMVEGEDAVEDNPELQGILGGLMGCAFMGMGEGDLDTDFSSDLDGATN